MDHTTMLTHGVNPKATVLSRGQKTRRFGARCQGGRGKWVELSREEKVACQRHRGACIYD